MGSIQQYFEYKLFKSILSRSEHAHRANQSKVKFVLFNDATVIGRHSYGQVDTLVRRKPAAAT